MGYEGSNQESSLSHLTKDFDLQTKEFGHFTQDSWVSILDWLGFPQLHSAYTFDFFLNLDKAYWHIISQNY